MALVDRVHKMLVEERQLARAQMADELRDVIRHGEYFSRIALMEMIDKAEKNC